MGQGLYKSAVFLPPPPSYVVPSTIGEVHIECHGANQVPIGVRAAPAGSRFADYCIMYSHGNAEDLGQMVELIDRIARHVGVNVACYDYQGYGPSYGVAEPGEDECFRDARFVFDFLTSADGPHRFASERVVLFGRSLGSGPTTHLARELTRHAVPFAGVILQSPLTSAIRVVSKPLSHIAADMFQNYKKIAKVGRPVTIVHGTDDEVVPFDHGEQLAQSLVEADSNSDVKRLVDFVQIAGAGHNDIEMAHWQTLNDAIVRHLDSLQQQPEFSWIGAKKTSSSISSSLSS